MGAEVHVLYPASTPVAGFLRVGRLVPFRGGRGSLGAVLGR